MFKKIKAKINSKIYKGYRVTSYCVAASMQNNQTFTKYKNIHLNDEIVMCGAGPSFQNYIPLKGVKHVALNRALLNDKIKFDYFIADDWDGINFMQDYLEKYDCVKFFGHQIGDYFREIPESFKIKCTAERYYTDCFMVENGYKSIPVCDINYLPIGNMPNIALSAMQIILFMHPKKIYLVGCDASANGHYTEKGVSKVQKDRHINDSKESVSGMSVIECWLNLKKFIHAFYPDIEIVSINPVGLKGIFGDYYQDKNGNLIAIKS